MTRAHVPWWRHQMETFPALLAICAGNSPVTGEFPAQRPVTRSFDVFFDPCLNNSWVNNCEAGDLRRRRTHYNVIVMLLTHWGRVMQICVSKPAIIVSDNGLSPGRRQAIIWTNAGILLTGPLGTNFNEILIEIQIFSFKKMHLKNIVCETAAILSRPQCVNVFAEYQSVKKTARKSLHLQRTSNWNVVLLIITFSFVYTEQQAKFYEMKSYCQKIDNI